jgi:hypothetical protein
MKNRLNTIVLALEITAIVILHAVKLNQADKKPGEPKANSQLTSSIKEPSKLKLPYILINLNR